MAFLGRGERETVFQALSAEKSVYCAVTSVPALYRASAGRKRL
jgi:hypothetical protein